MSSERRATVRGTPAAIEAWLATLSDPVAEGWSHAVDIEQRLKGKRNGRWPICLVWSGNGRHPRTALFLRPLSDSEVGVMSIVPLDRKALAPGDRDAVLQAFRSALLDSGGGELQFTDRPDTPGLSDLISPQAQAHLAVFTRTANRTSLHPDRDLPRWYDFLIQLHRDEARPPGEALEAELKAEGFSPEVIERLLDAYAHTDALLTRYEAFGGRG